MRRAPRLSARLLQRFRFAAQQAKAVEYHRERLDGSGYYGAHGSDIPLAAHFLILADAFDAMSSGRPYRRGLPPSRIDAILRDGAGTQWDADVVAALFACRADVEAIRARGVGESLGLALHRAVGRGGTARED